MDLTAIAKGLSVLWLLAFEPHSDLYRRLKELSAGQKDYSMHSLYSVGSSKGEERRSAEVEIDLLLADGFYVELGELPGRDYQNCGRYRVVTNEVLRLRRPASFLLSEYLINLSILPDCTIVAAEGVTLKPAQL